MNKVHGSTIHQHGTPGAAYDQEGVIEVAEGDIQRMKDGELEVHPVTEHPGELLGKKGTFKTFFVTEDVS